MTLPIAATEAAERILAEIRPMPAEDVPLTRAAGSVLAEDVVATVTHPPWRNASMDGYAVRAADVTDTPATLRVIGHVPAGQFPERDIGHGEAMKVMTGAPVPPSADSIVRIEDTDRGNDTVEIRDTRDLGRNIRPRGEDFLAGDVLLEKGCVVTPAVMGVLASAGVATVHVHRRPTVAVITSGDELVLLDRFEEVRAGRRIVSSNSYSLPALVHEAGGVPCNYGIAEDRPESLRQLMAVGLGCDLVITTAGISIGDHDHTRQVVEELGATLKFWKVRIRPGAPLAFGTLDGRPWIGLSGNPVSAIVTFELFVRPAIRRMCGHSALFPVPVTVTLAEDVSTAAPLTHFLRAVVEPGPSGYVARLAGTQSSAALKPMAAANALLVVPEHRQSIRAGEQLRAIPLGSSLFMSSAFPE